MTNEAKAAQAAYMREYRKKHPEKTKATNQRYWEKKGKCAMENAKCNYCSFEDNGDFPEDYKYLIEDGQIDVKSNCAIKNDLFSIGASFKRTISLSVGVDNPNNISIYGFYNDEEDGFEDFTLTGKIHYCPICGRKL